MKSWLLRTLWRFLNWLFGITRPLWRFYDIDGCMDWLESRRTPWGVEYPLIDTRAALRRLFLAVEAVAGPNVHYATDEEWETFWQTMWEIAEANNELCHWPFQTDSFADDPLGRAGVGGRPLS